MFAIPGHAGRKDVDAHLERGVLVPGVRQDDGFQQESSKSADSAPGAYQKEVPAGIEVVVSGGRGWRERPGEGWYRSVYDVSKTDEAPTPASAS